MPHYVSIVNTGMIVAYTGNIMAAMTREFTSPLILKLYRTSPNAAIPAKMITKAATLQEMTILLRYAPEYPGC